MIYFLRTLDDERLVKIGYTDDGRVRRRVKEVEKTFGLRLKIIGAIEGNLKREREWHDKWAGQRQFNEFFSPTRPMVEEIVDAIIDGYGDTYNPYFHIARQVPELAAFWCSAFLIYRECDFKCWLNYFDDCLDPTTAEGFEKHPNLGVRAKEVANKEILDLTPICDDECRSCYPWRHFPECVESTY